MPSSSSDDSAPDAPGAARSASRVPSGVRAFRAIRPVRYPASAAAEAAAVVASVGVTSSFDQVWKSPRSPAGTPSRSQITVTGSGSAYAPTRSAGPVRGIRSSKSRATASTRGRSAAIRPGVKWPATSRRSRVWCGGSLWSMLRPTACPPSVSQPAECRMSLRSRGSVSAARTASRVTTSQASPLPGTCTRWTGPSARRAARRSKGKGVGAHSRGADPSARMVCPLGER
ncbi:hypothetical protein STENM223S_00199 [Streptomyces tendae]